MLKNRAGFAFNSCRFEDAIDLHTIRQIYIGIKMAFFSSDRILLVITLNGKNTSKIPLEIGSRFETYFSWSSKTGPCIFLDQAKYRAKYSYLWYLTTGLSNDYCMYVFTIVCAVDIPCRRFLFRFCIGTTQSIVSEVVSFKKVTRRSDYFSYV